MVSVTCDKCGDKLGATCHRLELSRGRDPFAGTPAAVRDDTYAVDLRMDLCDACAKVVTEYAQARRVTVPSR